MRYANQSFLFFAIALCVALSLFAAQIGVARARSIDNQPSGPSVDLFDGKKGPGTSDQALENAKTICGNGSYSLVETIPSDLNITTPLLTHEAWIRLINGAKKTVHISSIYSNLLDNGLSPDLKKRQVGRERGIAVFNALIKASKRNVDVHLVVDGTNNWHQEAELKSLKEAGVKVSQVNVRELLGGGIVHTKMIVVDAKSYYLGSANLGWTALAQVKEMGIVVFDCPQLAKDLKNIWDMYNYLAGKKELPTPLPSNITVGGNASHPMKIFIDNEQTPSNVFFAASPQRINEPTRSWDLDAFVSVMNEAKEFIRMEVMDYTPQMIFSRPKKYFAAMDTALRNASTRGVKVEFIVSKWAHTYNGTLQFYKSLDALENIDLKFMRIPELPVPFPYTRVNHAKFCVSEKTALISTSNYQGDYFMNTFGVTQVFHSKELVKDLSDRFNRDWESTLVHSLDQWAEFK